MSAHDAIELFLYAMLVVSIGFLSLLVLAFGWSSVDIWLQNRRWHHRWRGGHWECRYIDYPVCGAFWFHEHYATQGTRPGLGRGRPTIEDWP